ncbi:MAG TPA: DUF2891 domain-containing protein [Casimicrobiaceae bacterium]|nr:DUF2891 domain-containing protein [Casimicrobiaceae bacterium]
MSATLSLPDAGRYARIALANIEREFPTKLDHVIADAAAPASPRALHPAFFGSFDWHSCVHAHWLLVRVMKLHPRLPEAAAIRSLLDVRLAAVNIDAERAYLDRPESRAFERTYGWAWFLKLAEELACWGDADAHRWSRDLAPLTSAFVQRYLAYLPDATYPIRHGVHSNSAFGLAFALDFARACDVGSLTDACLAKARQWYLPDRDAAAQWEPSGADFLSPCLIEVDLMRRVLDADAFALWLGAFLPDIERREPSSLFTPANVGDRTDPHIVHLDGLNLSRAWCWRAIATALPPGDPRSSFAAAAASAHLSAGLEGVASGEYVGDHWLATFAVLALTT